MPNNDGLYTGQYWRDRAEQCRLMSTDTHNDAAKTLLQDIAHKYDLLSELAEKTLRPSL